MANRANAKHSTGPRTTAGKRRSRHNAFKHGFRTNLDQMDRENMNDFTALHGSVLTTYWPVSAFENALCMRIAVCLWRLDPDDPLAKAVADCFDHGFGVGGIGTLSRYEAHLSQDIARNIRLFEQARADRNKVRALWAELQEDSEAEADVNDR